MTNHSRGDQIAAIRALEQQARTAAQMVQDHRAQVFVALTRVFGGSNARYGDDQPQEYATYSPGTRWISAAGVTRIADDVTAAIGAGDEAPIAGLRAEERFAQEILQNAKPRHEALQRKAADAASAAHVARSAFLDEVSQLAYGPVEKIQADLDAAITVAEATITAAALELA
jgi:hypothetical protein